MILLEQHIEVCIYHKNRLMTFDVVEILTDEGDLSFKVMEKGDYLFMLIGKKVGGTFRLELSELDRQLDTDINWSIYSKVKISLYSIFLDEQPS